jgi:hypothetical protein
VSCCARSAPARYEAAPRAARWLSDQEKAYGVDFGIRDPVGNAIRIGKINGNG